MIRIDKIRAQISRALVNPVVQGSIIYTTASVINAAIPFFLLPVLTHYLTPEEYGIVSTFMVCSSILLLLVGLEQHGFIATNYFLLKGEALKNHVSNIWLLSSILFVALLGLLLAVQDHVANFFQLDFRWIMISLLVCYFQFISQINLTIWQLESKSIAYGAFQILNSLANYVISIILIVVAGYAEDGRIYGVATAAIVFGTFSFYLLKRQQFIKLTFDISIIKSSLFFSLPLIPHALAGWVNTGLDKILINNMVSISENGIYSISYQIAMLVGMIASAFNRAFAPFIFKHLTASADSPAIKMRLVGYTYIYYIILASITAILFIASPIIMKLLVGEEFYGAQSYLLWIMIGFLADGFYYGIVNYLFYARKTHFISFISISSCILHFLVSYLCIPAFGTIGAAYATAASFSFSFICIFYVANRVYPMPWVAYLKSLSLQNPKHE